MAVPLLKRWGFAVRPDSFAFVTQANRTTNVAVRSGMASGSVIALAALIMGCVQTSGEPLRSGTSKPSPMNVAETRDYSLFELASTWKDQNGQRVTLDHVAGQATVLSMIYTSCAATCPLIVADLKRIDAALSPAERPRVRFILVSLDPARDTPGRLSDWAKATHIDESRWTLLSGDDGDVRELAATLDVRYQRQPDGEMAHTNGIHIVDRSGRVEYTQPGLGGVDQTVQAIKSLLH